MRMSTDWGAQPSREEVREALVRLTADGSHVGPVEMHNAFGGAAHFGPMLDHLAALVDAGEARTWTGDQGRRWTATVKGRRADAEWHNPACRGCPDCRGIITEV